jgi:ribonuclease PH
VTSAAATGRRPVGGYRRSTGCTDTRESRQKNLATDENRRKEIEQLEGRERVEAEHLAECLALFEKRIEHLAKRMAELAILP